MKIQTAKATAALIIALAPHAFGGNPSDTFRVSPAAAAFDLSTKRSPGGPNGLNIAAFPSIRAPEGRSMDLPAAARAGRGAALRLDRRLGSEIQGVILLNLGAWAFDRYLVDSPWARIGERTMIRNLRSGLVWDVDGLMTNFAVHPLHGSTYFALARHAGRSFWASIPFALAGSAMWEYFMECEPPSLNDLVNTTVGGAYLGEVLGRLSRRILAGGGANGRIGRGLLAFVLDPVGGINRLAGSRTAWGEATAASDAGPLSLALRCGLATAPAGRGLAGRGGAAIAELDIELGDPFGVEAPREPFAYFRHRGSFRFGDEPAVAQSGYGLLTGWRLGRREASAGLLGLFLHFDLHRNEAFRLGGQSLGLGWLSKLRLGGGASFESALHAGLTLVGSCDNPYLRSEKTGGRDYNFGTGPLLKGEAALDLGRFGRLEMAAARYHLFVLDGTPGRDTAARFEASLTVPVRNGWRTGLAVAGDLRDSAYRGLPAVHARSLDLRLIVATGF